METKLGKNRTEAEVKRFTEEKERLEKEKDEIRAQLTQLRKERRELKEMLAGSTGRVGQEVMHGNEPRWDHGKGEGDEPSPPGTKRGFAPPAVGRTCCSETNHVAQITLEPRARARSVTVPLGQDIRKMYRTYFLQSLLPSQAPQVPCSLPELRAEEVPCRAPTSAWCPPQLCTGHPGTGPHRAIPPFADKILEQRLKEIEEECKRKESQRVDLELSLVEVKENLKKAESGPVTLGTAVDTTHLENAAPRVRGGHPWDTQQLSGSQAVALSQPA